ncbi:hypothetical protein [Bordetella sp. LUAb4]|uniref:hypothetical protein n=1 Tax=Bordetella sp. LUAb4 TaxID=2843195 RepID=UPI001E5136E5|nr:hypothetical protein [Bordetella sp. LUAb4]
MFRYLFVKSAAALLLGMCLTPAARASHEYIVTMAAWTLPSDRYIIVIFPPEGNAPNSVCMQTWRVPSAPAQIGMGEYSDRYIWVKIEDKDSFSCAGTEKYNTWRFEIRNYPEGVTVGRSIKYDVVGQGRFQFWHRKIGTIWYTQIIALNADKANPNDDPAFVYRATCGNPPNPPANCLGEDVMGKDAADQIYVYLGYPKKKN